MINLKALLLLFLVIVVLVFLRKALRRWR